MLFLGALLLLAYIAGSVTDDGRRLLAAARVAIEGAWIAFRPPAVELEGHFSDVAAGDAAAHRVRLLAPALAGGVLMAGGRGLFLDRCPGFVGCAAVEYDRHGRFVHGYPFRPEAYEAALVPHGVADIHSERAVGFEFAKSTDVFAIESYSNGDLAVVVRSSLSFPPDLGVARVDRAGRPRWFRAAAGTHHWPTVAHGRLRGAGAGLEDALVVPARRVGVGPLPGTHLSTWEARLGRAEVCAVHFIDYLQVIDGDGALLRELPVTGALLDTRHAPMLVYAYHDCDPLHLNSVDVLAAAGPGGLAAGDFLLSLRNIGALAVLDGEDGALKRIWRGSFYGQHGARAVHGPAGPTFLMFDNWGQERAGSGPGRLLALDVRSGQERTIFPNASSPPGVQLRSRTRGGVKVAPGGSRAIVYAYKSGRAVEVDLATGEATAVFQALDDVSAFAGKEGADQAYRWRLKDIGYVAVPVRGRKAG